MLTFLPFCGLWKKKVCFDRGLGCSFIKISKLFCQIKYTPIANNNSEKYFFRALAGSWCANFAPTFANSALAKIIPKKAGKYTKPREFTGSWSLPMPRRVYTIVLLKAIGSPQAADVAIAFFLRGLVSRRVSEVELPPLFLLAYASGYEKQRNIKKRE